MSIKLYFPLLNGGIEQGLNDAGIETFEGEFEEHIVRECAQNAMDARASAEGQVRIRIQLRQIPAADIPGLGEIQAAIRSSRSYWHDNATTAAFCAKALVWTEGQDIAVLEVSDYGTTGLEGDDGDRNGSWFGLVQASGVAIKADDAGGGFGIGKKASFAGSFIRTVFYSTMNRQGLRAFQGVSTLTTHLDPAGRKTQAVGFVGNVVDEYSGCLSVRDPDGIPSPFRRTEIGTSIFIVAYRYLGGADWFDVYVRKAVENFWPAIHRGSLVFEIGDRRIDSASLPALMARYSSDPDFTSRFFYRAVSNDARREWQTVLPSLGTCRLHLVAGDATYPKKVCMTRQIGMVIYTLQHFRSYSRFAGLFVCESSEGNAYLRKLEPPRHDKWDPNRADDAAVAKRVLQQIRDWINECLRDLNQEEDAGESDVPELNRYLPDEDDEPLGDDLRARPEPGGKDGLVRSPISQPLTIQEVLSPPPVQNAAPDGAAPGDGNEEGDGAGDGQPDPGDDKTETPGGQSATTGAGATGANQPHAVKTLLRTRSIRTATNTYELIVRSTAACSGRLNVVGVGEDNKEEPDLRITRVLDACTGLDVDMEAFAIAEGQAVRLRLVIESTVPVSLRAYCCYGD